MANAPDLMNLLCLDPKSSRSPFGGNHRLLLIEKDFTNSGDFVLNNLLQHFGRREPSSQIILITLSHDWLNYSASATKCGFNLRKKQNMGNIEVLNVMEKYLSDALTDKSDTINYCDFILNNVKSLIDGRTSETEASKSNPPTPVASRPLVLIIDDLSILLTLGASKKELYELVTDLDSLMRDGSESLPGGKNNHLIVQTMFTNIKAKQSHEPQDEQLNFVMSNLENTCDICLTLRPLETGHSTRVDGTIKIVDNRLSTQSQAGATGDGKTPSMKPSLSMFPSTVAEIGSKKAYFYKLSDRRVRLATSAMIF